MVMNALDTNQWNKRTWYKELKWIKKTSIQVVLTNQINIPLHTLEQNDNWG